MDLLRDYACLHAHPRFCRFLFRAVGRHRSRMTRISTRELAGTSGPFGRGLAVTRPAQVPEGSVVTVMRVPPEAAGMRLDRFVQTQLKRTSRTRTQQIIALG